MKSAEWGCLVLGACIGPASSSTKASDGSPTTTVTETVTTSTPTSSDSTTDVDTGTALYTTSPDRPPMPCVEERASCVEEVMVSSPGPTWAPALFTTTYDSCGLWTTEQTEVDGYPDDTVVNHALRGPLGYLMKKEYGGGAFETYAYDDDGNEVEQEYWKNGVAERGTSTTWVDGNPVVREYWYLGSDTTTATSTFDELGQVLEEVQDLGSDGTPEWFYTFLYDGEELLRETQSDATGTITKTIDYEWVDGQNVAIQVDFGADGVIDLAYTIEYDALGRQSLMVEDDDQDGLPDTVWATTWTCP